MIMTVSCLPRFHGCIIRTITIVPRNLTGITTRWGWFQILNNMSADILAATFRKQMSITVRLPPSKRRVNGLLKLPVGSRREPMVNSIGMGPMRRYIVPIRFCGIIRDITTRYQGQSISRWVTLRPPQGYPARTSLSFRIILCI